MGGAIGKDHAATEYKETNIYLNSQKTYGRLKPERPITIHQKALFCLWIIIILLYLIVKAVQLWKWIGAKWKEKDIERESNAESQKEILEENKRNVHIANGGVKLDGEISKEPALTLWERLWETCSEQPSFENFLSHAVVFGFIMLYFWLCDFQHIWPKTDKQYSRDIFIFIFFVLIFVAFLFTIESTSDKILNRDQTEEWKGWMQVQFVWYHYYDAQEVFNSIRCYIGAYVWMTGYGNFWYFYTKKDYSFFRLAKMMWRLNFLVVMVMAMTNHAFVRYYVCAMHTYWFLTVYAMLALFSRYNQNRIVMAAKFMIYFVVNAIIFEFPSLTYKIFWPFQLVLNVGGNLDYWVYRSTLDHWATWVGMLVAYNYSYYDDFLRYLEKDDGKRHHKLFKNFLKTSLTVVCVIIIGLWFHYILLVNRQWYQRYHPYTSIIPMLAYVWLRNLHPLLRMRYLNLFNWLGKITLETYLSQIHIYMIGNAKKILVYIHNYPMMNFVLATLIYIGVSYVLFHDTVLFSSFLLPKNMRILCKNFISQAFCFWSDRLDQFEETFHILHFVLIKVRPMFWVSTSDASERKGRWLFKRLQFIWSKLSPFFDVYQFKADWCRQRKAALDWKAILEPCKLDIGYNCSSRPRAQSYKTSPEKSRVANMRISSAGQFSKIWIESRDSKGRVKGFGGDSWRVMVRSDQATVAADVFDHNNGSYEALFLLMEPGLYTLDIILDYTLCDGLRDPPMEWFYKVHCSGVLPNQKDIGTELFADMKDYINEPIAGGTSITIMVPMSNADFFSLRQLMVQADNECNIPCKKLWDGYGRWNGNKRWSTYLQEINLPLSLDNPMSEFDGRLNLDYISNHVRGSGIFWIYGDSLSHYFYESILQRGLFCPSTFKICNSTYNWIYPKKLYELTETCAETKLEVPKVLLYLREVTNNSAMDKQSALIFNAGIHYVKTSSFNQYKEAIKSLAGVLSSEYKGKPIWKSTSAIHDQTATVMGSFRRFTTDQRVKLFNAYGTSVMCDAGVTLLDIYPISASYPLGTKDGVHYDSVVFYPVEDLLLNYFASILRYPTNQDLS